MRLLWIMFGVALVVVACGGPAEDASGEEIYLQVCARCHAPDKSGGLGPALGPESEAAERTDDFLIDAITHGRGRMPSFAQTLSESQIRRVVDYLRRVQAGT